MPEVNFQTTADLLSWSAEMVRYFKGIAEGRAG